MGCSVFQTESKPITSLFISLQIIRKDGKPPKLKPKEADHKKVMKTDLIYLSESPDYCEKNEE